MKLKRWKLGRITQVEILGHVTGNFQFKGGVMSMDVPVYRVGSVNRWLYSQIDDFSSHKSPHALLITQPSVKEAILAS